MMKTFEDCVGSESIFVGHVNFVKNAGLNLLILEHEDIKWDASNSHVQ